MTITGLLWGLFSPTKILLFLLASGVAATIFRLRRTGAILLIVTASALCLIAILPIGGILITVLEGRFQTPDPMPVRVDGIIVLGGATSPSLSRIHGQPVLNSNAQRLTTFATLARRYPDARLAFTGGGAKLDNGDAEADVARAFLAGIGVDMDRVDFEDRSRSTFENAVFSKQLLKPRGRESWLLVTSALHMPRAVGSFRAAGWSVVPYPTGFRSSGNWRNSGIGFNLAGGLSSLEKGSHEWVGLVVYWLLDRSNEVFPSNAGPA